MSLRCLITTFLLISAASTLNSEQSQRRVSDGDLERLLRNLRDHSRLFQLSLENALKRGGISRTSRARNAQQAADSFERGSEALLNDFIRTKRGEDKLRSLQRPAQQMHTFVNTYKVGRQATARWGRIEADLQQIRSAYAARNSAAKENAGGKSTNPVSSGSAPCLQDTGEERATRLVDQCLEISPATHPPCNSSNPCALIVDEIKRSCALLDPRRAPAFCKEYR